MKNTKTFSKKFLVESISKNNDINIIEAQDEISEDIEFEELEDLVEITEENFDQHMEDSIASANHDIDKHSICEFTIEETEGWLKENSTSIDQAKLVKARALNLSDLRMIALKHILPKAKKTWLQKAMGRD